MRASHPIHRRRILHSLLAIACWFVAWGPAQQLAAENVAWRMVVIPDTQYYVARGQIELDVVNDMMQWIADNHEEQKIQFVLNVGDLVQTANSDAQWQSIQDAYFRLNGHVPYALTTGNHDHGESNSEHRGTKFNEYFKPTDNPLNDPAQGGALIATRAPDMYENAFFEFTAPDGRQMLVNTLEWSPRDGTVAWANDFVSQPQYRNHTAILSTHAYLYFDDTRYDYVGSNDSQSWSPYRYPTANDPDGVNDGEDLWQKLVRSNPNYEMVVNGHVLGDQVARLTSVNDAGENVYQMLYNAQNDPRGGNGWMRILEFLDDGRTVHVRTYSHYLHQLHGPTVGFDGYRIGDNYDFYITLSPVVPEPGAMSLALLGIVGLVVSRGRGRRAEGRHL